MYPPVERYIIYPILQRIRNEKTLCLIKELEKSQWYSLSKIRELQWIKLKNLLKHVYENVPFYRKKFDEINLIPQKIKDFDDFLKVPYITKEEIQENLPYLIAKNHHRRLFRYYSGGSTGKPLMVLKDPISTSYFQATRFRGRRWFGINIGDKEGRLWGLPVNSKEKVKVRLRDFLMNRKRLSVFNLSEHSMYQYFKRLRYFKPQYLYGYVSAIEKFAEYLSETGLDGATLGLKVVITTSEILSKVQRKIIESVFNCRVVNEYGASEVSILAFECPNGGMHIMSDNVYIEFIRDDKLAPLGEIGEIVVTELHNYSMPIVRYKIGDAGISSNEACSCGRGLPLVKRIEGRLSDILMDTKGRIVHSEVFYYVIKSIVKKSEEIKQFRFIQRSKKKIIAKIVKGRNYTSKTTVNLINRLHKFLGQDMEIEVEFVNGIPLEKSGKRRHFISEISSDFLHQ